jgi:hypothetical protein
MGSARSSVYLLYWYKSTNTDAAQQVGVQQLTVEELRY